MGSLSELSKTTTNTWAIILSNLKVNRKGLKYKTEILLKTCNNYTIKDSENIKISYS